MVTSVNSLVVERGNRLAGFLKNLQYSPPDLAEYLIERRKELRYLPPDQIGRIEGLQQTLLSAVRREELLPIEQCAEIVHFFGLEEEPQQICGRFDPGEETRFQARLALLQAKKNDDTPNPGGKNMNHSNSSTTQVRRGGKRGNPVLRDTRSKALKDAITASGLTLPELTRRVHPNDPTEAKKLQSRINNYKSATAMLPDTAAAQLAPYLGVSVEQLLTGSSNGAHKPPEEKKPPEAKKPRVQRRKRVARSPERAAASHGRKTLFTLSVDNDRLLELFDRDCDLRVTETSDGMLRLEVSRAVPRKKFFSLLKAFS